MKKQIMILTVLLASSAMLQAHCGSCGTDSKHDTKKTRHKHHSKIERIERLNLSSEQESKYNEITEKYHVELKKLKEAYKAEVMSLLDEDQKKAFDTKECSLCKEK